MTRIASHRGGTLEFGDSTPLGFSSTARMALDEVEFDVHPTRDGAIIVHHDATLDRTTDRSGAIAALSEAEVRAAVINYSAGGHPMSLAELCAIYADSAVDLRCEIKPDVEGRAYPDFVPRVIEVLDRHGMLGRTTFSSFLIASLDELAVAAHRPRLWLVSPPVLRQLGPSAVVELARSHAIPEVGVHIDCADTDLKTAVQAGGLEFGCWAAHSAEQIEKALNLRVKVFTTDRPSLAIALRNRMDKGGNHEPNQPS
ncbi:glycerophosphodiester phosphodiesterase family protein [Microvirga lotononidis]|uniref:Glycerophosphoryl diester phosphodiesterase n=1 Tax=Microvirga lotononidis TaxID=864069 RepID=I4YWM4_9HYPH|nr:glycerophosphodiester phosphodiesterase family protein [Microvirga lotononidis]EIM28366.1 glycerophosphoryl diester phosphodiesterase [Microvirga lotononidis]WQO27549.1 glycerophosphodiester phosphodiesterase family protein [Microvirga lotononidis]